TPLVSECTCTGTSWSWKPPLPSCPAALAPQQRAAPPATTAQLWSVPAVMASAPLPSPATVTGSGRMMVLPSPSWPDAFAPQHFTAPPAATAQLWNAPVLRAVTPLSSPGTAMGVERNQGSLSPSCPLPLLPQHCTPPASVRAQLWLPPAPTCATPPRPATGTGGKRSVLLP